MSERAHSRQGAADAHGHAALLSADMITECIVYQLKNFSIQCDHLATGPSAEVSAPSTEPS